MTAIVVLGMHRSGTSCLAGMLASAGLASAGAAVRNWDNARGHFEALEMVRLNEAVLAHSGGHWLSPPPTLRWHDDHAVARDRLLCDVIDGRSALLKDPRTLLCLPFWRASSVPFHVIGIVRHPLAVARSLEAWRGTPLNEGLALWLAHNRALAADVSRHGYPVIDFSRSRAEVVEAVCAACSTVGLTADRDRLAAAYEETLVHHDDVDASMVSGLDEALALYRHLSGNDGARVRPGRVFPRAAVAACLRHLSVGYFDEADSAAAEALNACADRIAVLVPLVTAYIRARAFVPARRLIDSQRDHLANDVAHLLRGKVLLAAGDPAAAAEQLLVACAVAEPYFQARHLLPHALRQAGRLGQARSALRAISSQALYPHGPLATLAEWSWLDGEHEDALTHMGEAIAAAPAHRRGRLRTRCAEWLDERGDRAAARAELEQALREDPDYRRAAEVLKTLA